MAIVKRHNRAHNHEGEAVMSRIVIRLKELLEERNRTGQELTLEQLALTADISYATVLRWYKGQVTRADFPTLLKFGDKFGWQPGDLIVYERDDE